METWAATLESQAGLLHDLSEHQEPRVGLHGRLGYAYRSCSEVEVTAMAMDVIDFEIFGDDMQFVEIELDPPEAAIGEAGAMMMMQDGIQMDTVFGDSSQQSGGLFDKLLGAGKR